MGCRVGTFVPAASATDQLFNGVGFRPRALMLFSTRSAAGAFEPHADMLLGFATADVDTFQVTYRSDDNLATSNALRYREVDRIIEDQRGGYTIRLVRFNDDGFTLNFDNVPNGETYAYLALGGDFDAHVGNFALSNVGTPQSVTGVGFQPEALIFLWAHRGANGLQTTFAAQGMGFASGAANEACAMWFSNDAQANAQDRHQWFTDRCIAIGTNGVAGDRAYANLASFDADGFTLNVTDLAGGGDWLVGYLALAGFPAIVLTDTAKTGATGLKSYTGVGFEPNTLLTLAQFDTADSPDATAADSLISIGASAAGGQALTWQGGVEAAPTTEENNRLYDDAVVAMIDPGSPPTELAVASLGSFDTDGFALDWTTVTATAYEFSYLAMDVPPSAPRFRGGNRWWWWRGF
jgi:hypothetical protein